MLAIADPRPVVARDQEDDRRVELVSDGFPLSYSFYVSEMRDERVSALAPHEYVSAGAPFGLQFAESPLTVAQPGSLEVTGAEDRRRKSTAINTTTDWTGFFLDTYIDCNKD